MSAYPATCHLGHRLNAFRLNYLKATFLISIGGIWSGAGAGQDLLIESLTISDRLYEVPNTLIATVRGTKPIEGQVIRIAIGSRNAAPLFAGNILRVTRVWAADNPAFVLYQIEATDPTWRLNALTFSARYRNQSASAIAADIITKAPAGFTPMIEPGLPVLDEISFTNVAIMDALAQLATRIGGYTLCDYDGRVYLFTTADTISPPVALTANHKSLGAVSYVRDLTQIITRAVVEGGGGNALAPIPPGSTSIPVDPLSWYAEAGGYVRSGPQRIRYTGIAGGGAGAFAGEGTTPTTPPTLAINQGPSAIEDGSHSWAYTWVTGTGESLPSPLVSITLGGSSVSGPSTPPPIQNYAVLHSNLTIGATYTFALGWNYNTDPRTMTALSPLGAPASIVCGQFDDPLNPPNPHAMMILWGYYNHYYGTIDPAAKHLCWYRKVGSDWYFENSIPIAQINDGIHGSVSSQTDAAIVADTTYHPRNPSPAGNVVKKQVIVSGIAPGPAGVSSRKVYRTAANASQLKLHSTIADNTTTAMATYDNTSDAALGANAPIADTAGIIQTSKIIPAGSTTMRLTSTGPFLAAGGYALAGSQAIRYAGKTATDITGIPASGDGALLQSISWGTPVTVPPALVGVPAAGAGSIVWPIAKGDPVNIVILVDDAAAQATLAAAIGGDGIRESLLQDGRISITEATARGRALLEGHKAVIETVTHRSRDPHTRSGQVIDVALPPPTDITGSYRIQDVQISTFNPRAGIMPAYDTRSSSQQFTFEDLVRRMTSTTPPPATGEDR